MNNHDRMLRKAYSCGYKNNNAMFWLLIENVPKCYIVKLLNAWHKGATLRRCCEYYKEATPNG